MATVMDSGYGLASLLKDLQKIGILLENGESIILLIQNYEKKLQDLKKDVANYRESTAKKEQELLNWMTKHIEDRQIISKLESELVEKSHAEEVNIYETIKPGAAEYAQELKGIIELLESEKVQVQLENDSLKKKISELEKDLTSKEKAVGLDGKIERLNSENKELLSKTADLDEELQQWKDKTNELRLMLCSSDVKGAGHLALCKDLEEETAKLKETEARLKDLQDDNERVRSLNDTFRDEIAFLKRGLGESDVIKKQQELEHSFTLEQVSTLKKEKISLMDEMEKKVKDIHDMKMKEAEWKEMTKEIEFLKKENKCVQIQLEKEKKANKDDIDVVRSQLERSKIEITYLQKEIESKNKFIVDKDLIIREMQEQKVPSETSENESMYAQRENALQVQLKKINVNGRKQFGVFLASRPSRVLITYAIEAQKNFVRPGDFVLTINGVNVQNATNDFIWNLIDEDIMNLVLLRPGISEQEYDIKRQDKGMRVHHSFTISQLSTAALNSGIRIGDEIVKVNDHDVDSLTLHKIEKSVSKPSVKLYIRRTEEQIKSASMSASHSEKSLNDSHAYETIDETHMHQRISKSRASLISSKSSASHSTNKSLSIAEESPHGDPLESTNIRRAETFDSQITSYVNKVPLKDLLTEQSAVVTNQGTVIRDDDTEGSGDSEVVVTHSKRRAAREEPPPYEEYIDMRKSNVFHPGSHSGPLSDIPETAQNEASSQSSSDQDRTSYQSQQSPIINRPPPALPNDATQPHQGEYQYVGCERRHSKFAYSGEVTLTKQANERSFGFTIFGGNHIGIFIEQVDTQALSVRPEELPVGARVVSMNGVDLVDAAFCFAIETLRSFSCQTSLKITIVPTPAEKLAKYRVQRPYDSVSLRALVDAPKMPGCTLPFKAGEILRVTDTYKDYDSESGSYIWHAMKTMDRGVYDTVREGSIPAEQSSAFQVTDEYPELFDVYGGAKIKKKSGILSVIKKRASSDTLKGTVMFPHGSLYEYIDDSIRI